ncbi:MAG: hypothetical protein JXA07_07440 [Spirochaetes bacterium]|nr:hypothetical protein [Spirochaetota bacterium]
MKRRVEIRPMQADDLREVFLLGRECFSTQATAAARVWNERTLADVLASGLDLSFVARYKKKVSGFLIARPDGEDDAVMIEWLCAGYISDGPTAEELLQVFQQSMSERMCVRIDVVIPRENQELSAIFKKFGFTESNQQLIMENFPQKQGN